MIPSSRRRWRQPRSSWRSIETPSVSSRSKSEPRWISKKATLAIYERLLAEHGGVEGVPDEGSLEAALAAPRNHLYYSGPDLFTLAAVHAHAITRNHPFLDGNKRV